MENNFCKIYVCSSADENLIKDIFERGVELNKKIKAENVYIDKNDEFSDLKERDFPDGFLYFKYTIDIDFNESNKNIDCKDYINFLLNELWRNKIAAVASCDYENLLLHKGGYKSKETPWV